MELTKEEKKLAQLLRLMALISGISGFALLAFPFLDKLVQWQFHNAYPLLHDFLFWRALAHSMFFIFPVLCLLIACDIRNNRRYLSAVLVSLFASSFVFLVFYLKFNRTLYLISFIVELGAFALISIYNARITYVHRNESVFFSPKQNAILTSLVARVIPRNVGFETGGGDVKTIKSLDQIFHSFSPLLKTFFPLLLYIFEYSTNIFVYPFSSFTALSPDAQDLYIEGWRRGRLRKILLLFLTGIINQGFYVHEEVWANIGYKGPWVKEK